MAARNICILIPFAFLVACSETPQDIAAKEAEANSKICQTVPPQAAGQWGACIHRMAYKYAGASDPAEIVAKAVATACGQAISEQINSAEQSERERLAMDIMGSVEGSALAKVIEARAGHCEIPD